MDLVTILELLAALVVGLGGGVWVMRKKRTVKGGDKSSIVSETAGDVIQTSAGHAMKVEKQYNIIVKRDPQKPIPGDKQDDIKRGYEEAAKRFNADENLIKHAGAVATTSSSTVATVWSAIPYLSGVIAQATGNEENAIADEIIREAGLGDDFYVAEEWECPRCGNTNTASAHFCSNCGKQRNSESAGT